jgi:hypothetical protein
LIYIQRIGCLFRGKGDKKGAVICWNGKKVFIFGAALRGRSRAISILKKRGKKTFKKRASGICRIRKREYLCSPFCSGERGAGKGKRSLEK